jgi:hypothetical protein
VIPCCLFVIFCSSKLDIQILEYLGHNTTRNIVIGYALSKAVHLEPLLEHIKNSSSRLESLLISVQLISSGSSFEPLLIMPSLTAVLN